MEELIATRDVYGETLVSLGEINKDIVVLDADLSSSTKTGLFRKRFSERFFNMGISEQDMMGTAAGLANYGKIPFVSTFAIFATGKAWEQIRQSIAYPSLNVKIVATHAGITVGEDGASHQSVEDISLMRTLPTMTIIVPADAVETEKAIRAVINYKGPVYVRLSRTKFPVIYDRTYPFQIGKGHIFEEGKDVTIFATGLMVSQALKASKILKEMGIRPKVVNISTIKPIDEELIIASAKETGAVVTCEEHSIIGGLGSAVCEVLSENYPVRVKRIGIQDKFGKSGSSEELIKYFHLTPEDIVKAVKELCKRSAISGQQVNKKETDRD